MHSGGGIILFDEFSKYVKLKEISAHTPLGNCLAEQQQEPSAEELEAKRLQKETKIAAKKAKRNTPILETPFGLTLCRGVSEELLQFVKLFGPMAEDSDAGDERRAEGFVMADPNGNGLCSLAELETYILKKLQAAYPRTGKGKEMREPGRELFNAFRPYVISLQYSLLMTA